MGLSCECECERVGCVRSGHYTVPFVLHLHTCSSAHLGLTLQRRRWDGRKAEQEMEIKGVYFDDNALNL